MRPIAEGKDAVLHFLENETLKRTDEKPGVWQLTRDDANNLILHIEGFTFIGSGTVSYSGNLLNVTDGIVASLQKPS